MVILLTLDIVVLIHVERWWFNMIDENRLEWEVVKEEEIPSSGGASTWEQLKDKPDTFPPSEHIHSINDISNAFDVLISKFGNIENTITSGAGIKNFRAQAVDMDTTSPYMRRVILLMPVCESNVSWNNICVGTFILLKNGANIFDTIDIRAQSTYNRTLAGMFSMGDYPTGHTLVTCSYMGIKWLALRVRYQANPYNNMWFYGFSTVQNNDKYRLKCIAYFNEQTSTALVPEINNSIEDFTPTMKFAINNTLI